LELRNGTSAAGNLGALSEASFVMTNEENNALETHAYSEVARVRQAKEYIGAGSEGGHRIRRWIPVVAGVLAGGAAAAAFAMR